jgi:hypothetical protein
MSWAAAEVKYGCNGGTRSVVPVAAGPTQTTVCHITLRVESSDVMKSPGCTAGINGVDGMTTPACALWAYWTYACTHFATASCVDALGMVAWSNSGERPGSNADWFSRLLDLVPSTQQIIGHWVCRRT